MQGLSIVLEGDGCWPDLRQRPHQHHELVAVAALDHGTQAGKPTVLFRIDLPDGTTVIGETTMALLFTAVDAFRGRFGDPRESSTGGRAKH